MWANHRLPRATVVLALLALSLGGPSMALVPGKLLDMSYKLDADTLYWPGSGSGFRQIIGNRGPTDNFPWYEGNSFSAPEHGGTHMDAPAHFSEGKYRVDDIPIDKLVGPAVRVDISEQAKTNRDYEMTADDLRAWEGMHGEIPEGAILFVYSGWGAYYPDRLAYFGSARNDTYLDEQGESILHFPGVAPAAATWLVENRAIAGLGIDTPSIDHGPSTTFMTHRTLFAANIFALENVANLDQLPATGTRVYALPINIADGSGAPARIAAILEKVGTSGATVPSIAYCTLAPALSLMFALLCV